MVTRAHGPRQGTRKKMTKKVREKGKVHIKSHLQKFEVGESVLVKVDPSNHKGQPFPRFFGRQGKVAEKRGQAYLINIKDGNKHKKIICASVHLKKA